MRQQQYIKIGSNFDFSEALGKGYVVYGWKSSSGQRIVSIENPGYYQKMRRGYLSYKQYSDKVAIGRGPTIDIALKQALTVFNKGLSYDKMYNKRLAKFKIVRARSFKHGKLDLWMFDYNGHMRVLQDIDGKILCTLEGLKDLTGSHHRTVAYGRGPDFKTAVNDAYVTLTHQLA